jgi:hypothetical protein
MKKYRTNPPSRDRRERPQIQIQKFRDHFFLNRDRQGAARKPPTRDQAELAPRERPKIRIQKFLNLLNCDAQEVRRLRRDRSRPSSPSAGRVPGLCLGHHILRIL